MNDMAHDNKLYDKIAALLRKAETTTAGEAELLLGKAEELIAKYDLDDLRARSAAGYTGPADELGSEWVVFVFKTQAAEDAQMLNCLAQPNGCEVITSTKTVVVDGRCVTQKGAYLFGRASARKHVLWMYTSMLVTATRLQRSAGSGWPQRRAFRIGFAHGLYTRLTAVRSAAVNATAHEPGGSLLPALADEAAQLTEFIAAAIGRTNTGRRTGRLDGHAFRAGVVAANGVDVGDTRLPGRRTAIGAAS